MSSDDEYDKYPNIKKLTKENHKKWFRNSKLKLRAEGIFYTIEVTKHTYAWIAQPKADSFTSTATAPQGPTNIPSDPEEASILGLTDGLKQLGGMWDNEKAKEFDKDEANALFTS